MKWICLFVVLAVLTVSCRSSRVCKSSLDRESGHAESDTVAFERTVRESVILNGSTDMDIDSPVITVVVPGKLAVRVEGKRASLKAAVESTRRVNDSVSVQSLHVMNDTMRVVSHHERRSESGQGSEILYFVMIIAGVILVARGLVGR
ncbi:MAG: hypothetical protein K2I52_00690 [Muribaculaceae bacterium]|nr:hypothetical protein [Muribaculaceae bacterium]